jgi:hypothetical protein
LKQQKIKLGRATGNFNRYERLKSTAAEQKPSTNEIMLQANQKSKSYA